MPAEVPLLQVREVSKSFGAVAAVQNISFDLYGGEAHALAKPANAKLKLVKIAYGNDDDQKSFTEAQG